MEAKPDTLFGAVAVQEGFASEAEVEVALVAQKESQSEVGGVETPIGQILLEMGALNQAQIEAVLATQNRFRAASGIPERLPESQAIPSQRQAETSAPRLVQESGGPPRINGENLTEPRLLKPGDSLHIGGAVFRFEGDLRTAPVVVPGAPVAATPDEEQAPAPEAAALPAGEKPADPAVAPAPASAPAPSPVAALLKKADGLVSRLLPKVHNHRKYIVAAALLGLVSVVLPWRVAQNGNTVVGLQGPGWLTFWLLLISAGCAALTRVARPIAKIEWIVIASSSGLAVLASLWKFASAPAWAKGRGIGLYLTVLSAVAVHAVAWLIRKSASGPVAEDSGSEPAAIRLARVLHRFVRNFSGASAKEKAAQIQRRDELLVEIGRAALATKVEGPEAAAALEATQKVAAAEAAAKTDIKARAALKAAEGKAKRALTKLGRHALDKAVAPPDAEAKIAELRALEEKIGKES